MNIIRPCRLPRLRQLCIVGLHLQRWQFRSFSTNPLPALVYPESNTSAHRDLKSFLDYASRSELDTTSTVFVGTFYEYMVGDTLSRYGFDLHRIGGSSDGGIDLLGIWNNPSKSSGSLRVLVQCKGGGQKTGPRMIRELEGAFVSAPAGWRGDGILGVFVGEATATKGMRDAMAKSKWPMAMITCVPYEGTQGRLRQFLWNNAAEKLGLGRLGVSIKRSTSEDDEILVLTWDGKPLSLKKGSTNL